MDRGDFAKFFAAVNGGHTPFAWQERLLDFVLEHGRWPDQIAAPTGAGKTSAIDVHVFATALTANGGGPRLPRRLAMVVDRRVLVDDQHRRARALADVLDEALHQPKDAVIAPIVVEVAAALAGLNKANGNAIPGAPALLTARLRGGSVPPRYWRDHPTACAVLCATPDMWGSRLLFGGYGSRNEAMPREAGLLAFDSVVMVDEAHMARQLLVTARRVSQLALLAERPLAMVPALQVIEVSATPHQKAGADAVRTTVAVDEDDLGDDHLAARLTSPKPVTLFPVAEWPAQGRQVGKVAAAAANAVIAMRSEISVTEDTRRTIGCYVNTVPMALAVASALRESLRVVTVCGQVRPTDLARLDGHYPDLLTTHGNGDVDVLVTTQSLEVGADLDLAGIVTELASGSALAQRVGRANRLGKRPNAPVTVLVPPGELAENEKMRSGPYSAKELNEALDWVTRQFGTQLGLAPWAIRESPPPSAHSKRRLDQRPELGDAWHWARTSDALAAYPELDLWLSDSFEEQSSIGIVVRDAVPSDPADAVQFVRDLPPVPREVFPVPYRAARDVLAELLPAGNAMVRVRGEEVTTLTARPGGGADVRPGDIVVLDSSAAIFTETVDGTFSPPVVTPSSADSVDGLDAQRRGRADDVLHYQPASRPGSKQPGPRLGDVLLRIEWSPDHERIAGFSRDVARSILDAVTESLEDQDQSERVRRDSLAQLLATMRGDESSGDLTPVISAAVSLLQGKITDSEVILRTGISGNGDDDEDGARIVVLDKRRAVADEDLRQVFAPRGTYVLLGDHQRCVAARAQALGVALRFPTELTEALRVAGEHHDDGKTDQRFQEVRLGHYGDGEPWAKSDPSKSRADVRRQQAKGGLPNGWRHEQRSVVDGWDAVHAVTAIDAELALRLIGTSHGHGRSGFPHSASELAGPQESVEWQKLAVDLFDAGGWDELIEATHLRYGAWGCAFLEAILRAGDCQVSGEGK